MPVASPPGVAVASGSVFHYTDAGGLLGMVQRRTLWASEAAGLNDRAEVRQGWKKIRKRLKKLPVGEAADLLRAHAKSPLKRSHEVFVLCASTRADDANQWRSYASGGTGYAVELDANSPLAVVTDASIAPVTSSKVSLAAAGDVVEVGPWLHVLYDDADIDFALDSLIQSIEFESSSIVASSSATEDEKDHALQDLSERAYDDLAQIAHLIKEPGFAGENEVRIVATFFLAARHIKYRAGAYGAMGYAELASRPPAHPGFRVLARAEATLPLAMRSVRLGPLLHKEHAASVASLLRNHDLKDVKVKRSRVPLR